MIKLSFSSAQRYMTSPLSFFLHYYMRLRPIELSSALIFGGAVDEGLNCLLNAVKEGQTPSTDLAKEVFKQALELNGDIDTRIKGNVKFSKADLDYDLIRDVVIPPEHDPAWYALLAKGQLIIDAYAEQVIPKLEKVLLVQHEIQLENELGDTLIGVVDLVAQINGQIWILDNKTSSIKYAEDAVTVSQQLGTYYEALKYEYDLAGAGFIVIPKSVRKRKEPKIPIEIKLGQVSDGTLSETFQMYEKVLDGIKNGRFECTRDQRDGCCSAPWGCTFERYCASGGKDLTGLKIAEERKK